MSPLKVCNGPGRGRPCPGNQLTRRKDGLCPDCLTERNRSRDASRGNFRQRGYTTEFDKARAVLVPRAVGRPCPICTEIMVIGEIDLDHITPLSRGGSNDVTNLRAVCSRCNRGRRT